MNNQDLAHNVRGWVHYDNLCSTLQKQITNARKQRDSFEQEIQVLLRQHQMTNAVIQISGGQLQLQEEKSTSALTQKGLRESVQSFFKANPDLPDKSKELLDHIMNDRSVTIGTRLKKLRQQPPSA
jgi:hypothetical protein